MSKEININDVLVEIENYKIIEKIGEGRFGVVFRATEKKTNKDVALKVNLQADALKSANDQAEILREITVLRLLNLPGIVQFIGIRFPLTKDAKEEISKKNPNSFKYRERGIDNVADLSGAIIITELMKNGSLESLVTEYLRSGGKKNEKINPTIRSKIIFGVAATMKRVHAKNVIHRNLKLENIFLDDNLEPRIADFGLEKFIKYDDNMPMVLRIPYHMAPEMFMDEYEIYGEYVDEYAFAFLMYRMFTDTIQLDDKKPIRSPQQYMMKIARGIRPRRPDSIPETYWKLIQMCWAQEPANRMTFEEITEELKNDIYAIEEFGQKTDLDQLHEYQNRIDKDIPNTDFLK